MKFAGKTNKPCLVIRDGYDNLTKGSMRNPNGCPITELKPLLEQCPYVEWVFGHNNAAGVAIQTEHLDDFVDWFNDATKDLDFKENCFQVNFDITDRDLYFENLCWDIANHNNIWGGDNPQPMIHLYNVHVHTSDFVIMGPKKDTIKFMVNGIPCMIFRSPKLAEELHNMNSPVVVEMVGRPALNTFAGRTSVQFMVDKFEYHPESVLDF